MDGSRVLHGEFNILGCVEVAGPRGRAELTSSRQRALVAALALQPGVVVPTWRLVDALWGERPPRTALRSLHSHVARLRLGLEARGLGGAVQTRDPGYLLAADPSVVDAWRFEQDVKVGRASLVSGLADGAAETFTKALTLWRGEALADVEPTSWTAAQATRLEELRRAAIEDRSEALICLGRFGDALVELEQLLTLDSGRERLTGLHMIALCGSGRAAEAFESFQRLRRRLADELGVDPSQELAELHTALLRGAGAADVRAPGSILPRRHESTAIAPRPAQLPSRVGYFTGRATQLQSLAGLIEANGRAGWPVVLICGQGGIGKTSLAVQFAHQVIERFPDGQVFIDARGHESATALTAEEIIAVLLRCLGVPDDRVPNELGERIGLYRSLLAGKRMLIVLDNAGATSQIIPAIPNTARSLLAVTSRKDLAALVTHAEVYPIVLDVLTAQEANDLLARMLGAQRVCDEPESIERLAELCGRLPLALRIAGAKLLMRPHLSVGSCVDELSSGDRLAQLGLGDGECSVEAVFSSAYQTLTASARRLFCLLGLHPGPQLSTQLAAAIGGTSPGTQHDALAELSAMHLIAQSGPGRYRMHDLVRMFAMRRAVADNPEAVRTEAAQRLLDWYLVVAHAANQVLDSGLDRITPVWRHPAPDVPFAGTREAVLAFLESERDNLLPVVRFACDNGQAAAACQLAYLLTSFFDARGYWPQRVEMCQHAVRAARQLDDAMIESEMHRALGVAYRATRQLKRALDSHLRALALLCSLGDERGMAYVYNNIGGAIAEMRRFDEALAAYQMSLRLHRDCGNQLGVAVAQRNLGFAHIHMGCAERSFAHLHEALAISRAIGYKRLEAGVLDSLGEAYLLQGRHDEALRCFQEALVVSRSVGDRRHEMDALDNLGLTQLARGEVAAAVEILDQALAVSRAIAHRHGEARILNHLGEAHLRLGRHELAGRHLDASAEVRRTLPDAYEEAALHRNLGDLAQVTGRPGNAAVHWRLAVGLYRKVNAAREADCLAHRIAG